MDWTRSAGSVNKSKIDIVILGLAELTACVDIYLLRVSKEKFAMCAFCIEYNGLVLRMIRDYLILV